MKRMDSLYQFLAILILSIIIVMVLSKTVIPQNYFKSPSSFSLRMALPSEGNIFNSTWRISFSIRPILQKGNFMFMSGGEFRAYATDRYDLTSRSISHFGTHFGVGVFYNFQKKYSFGLSARRVMNFANDIPSGEGEGVIESIVEQYKIDNPGSRMLYYNQPSLGIIIHDQSGKVEFFFHLPLGIPVLNTVPALRKGSTNVATLFILAEVYLPNGLTVRADWEFHQGRPYREFLKIDDGTGGILLRKSIVGASSRLYSSEAGIRKQMDPTGHFRGSAWFLGLRVDFK